MSDIRKDEVYEQGDSPPEERLIESTIETNQQPLPVELFVGYDKDGNSIHYDDIGSPLTN